MNVAGMQKFDVAFCLDERFLGALAVVLMSIGLSLLPSDTVEAHIVYENVTDDAQKAINASIQCRHLNIKTTWYKPLHAIKYEVDATSHIGRAAFLRLQLGDVLPTTVERVLYLDCDLVVRGSFRKLWELDLGNNILMAVVDEVVQTVGSPVGIPETFGAYNLESDMPYFNSGVMLISLNQWRAAEVGRNAAEYLHKYSHIIRFADQDVLNAVIAGRWGQLHQRWNVQSGTPSSCIVDKQISLHARVNRVRQAYILHYTGPHKPWLSSVVGPETLEYKYLLSRIGVSSGTLWVFVGTHAPVGFVVTAWSAFNVIKKIFRFTQERLLTRWN